jgi:hypothetical protein
MCLGCKLHLNQELTSSESLRYEGVEKGGFAMIKTIGYLSLQGHKIPKKMMNGMPFHLRSILNANMFHIGTTLVGH